jgi:hypothetical protein
VAELVDAHDSKSCGSNVMGVRFPPSAQNMLFGILKLIGVVLFLYLTWRNLHESYNDERLVTYSWLGLLAFLVGGRVVFGFINFGIWNDNLTDWMAFWVKPGFDYWGGIGGWFLATVWYCRVNDWKLWSFLEDMTPIIYLFMVFLLAEETVKSNFNIKVVELWLVAVMGVIVSRLIAGKYRSVTWYKSGKKGFVFFFTNLTVTLSLFVFAILYKERPSIWISYMSLSLISLTGLFILGEVITNLEVFNKRRINGKS